MQRANYVPARKGGRRLKDEQGMIYSLSKRRENKSYYFCSEKKNLSCPATAVVENSTDMIIKISGDHAHDSNILQHNEVVPLRERVNQMLDDLHQSMDKEDNDLRGSWNTELERLEGRHGKEKKELTGRQQESLCELESKHRREKNEMMTKQTKQSFEMKLRQDRQLEELMQRQKEERESREREKNTRISKYVDLFKTPGIPAVRDIHMDRDIGRV